VTSKTYGRRNYLIYSDFRVKNALPCKPSLLTANPGQRRRTLDADEDLINIGLTLAVPDKVEHKVAYGKR
jgi:hypothetical protein